MAKTKINCLNCKNECYVETREINRGNGKFCSQKCSSQHRVANLAEPEKNVACSLCGKAFHKSFTKRQNSKSGLYFCCRLHKDEAQKIGGIKEIMPPHYGTASIIDYRKVAFEHKPKVCERCNYDKHQSAIIVHHKDRNRENNDITNLEVLCANCHLIEHYADSITST